MLEYAHRASDTVPDQHRMAGRPRRVAWAGGQDTVQGMFWHIIEGFAFIVGLIFVVCGVAVGIIGDRH